ncbi:hypothetical protein ACWGJ1_28225, partial [Bacillus wiedmannii]
EYIFLNNQLIFLSTNLYNVKRNPTNIKLSTMIIPTLSFRFNSSTSDKSSKQKGSSLLLKVDPFLHAFNYS